MYVLPDNNKITFESNKKEDLQTVSDSFGEKGIWPNKPTAGVTFLSYNDKAFTINCTEEEDFYKDIGICSESHSKILLPEANVIVISGLRWYFLNLHDPQKPFTRRSKGIYDQLYHNYVELKGKDGITMSEVLSYYKLFAIKKDNAKREVIVDENLTMKKMESIFSGITSDTIPYNAYECLIISRGKSKVYRYYFQAIKSLLTQRRFVKGQLDSIFTYEVKHMVRKFLKEKTDVKNEFTDFFKRTQFCYKTLYHTDDKTISLDIAEEFAFNVGKMARAYVDFRRNNKHDNNSLKDILSKQKYDVKTLQYVVKQIGRGINLIKLENNTYDDILDEMTKLAPKMNDEIDTYIRKDYSYYFYMGYFGGKTI